MVQRSSLFVQHPAFILSCVHAPAEFAHFSSRIAPTHSGCASQSHSSLFILGGNPKDCDSGRNVVPSYSRPDNKSEGKQSFEAHRIESRVDEDDDDSDYTDEEAGELISRSDNFAMSVEDWEKYSQVDKIRLLMWNPENLAQRLDLDDTVSRGKTNRMNSPPLRSVRKEWAQQIRAVDPEFIIYNEASLPGGNTGKRKNHVKVIQEAEQFHTAMGYHLLVGFEERGHASHGGAIAVKDGIVITDVKYSFTGGREVQGRVLCIRVETERIDGEPGRDGMWIVQMYMHNSGEAKRDSMMKTYEMWAKSHNEPVIIGSDTNSIDNIQEDVMMHAHKNHSCESQAMRSR